MLRNSAVLKNAIRAFVILVAVSAPAHYSLAADTVSPNYQKAKKAKKCVDRKAKKLSGAKAKRKGDVVNYNHLKTKDAATKSTGDIANYNAPKAKESRFFSDIERKGYYVEARGSFVKPLKLREGYTGYNIRNMGLFEAKAGYNFGKVDVDLTLTQSSKTRISKATVNTVEVPGTNINFRHFGKISFTSLMLSGYYNIGEYKNFTPYIGIGAGISRNKMDKQSHYADYDWSVNPPTGVYTPGVYNYNQTTKGATKLNLAWQGILGVRAKLKQNLELSLEYKYMYLGRFNCGTSIIFPDGSTDSGYQRKRSRLHVNSFLVGVRYYFNPPKKVKA